MLHKLLPMPCSRTTSALLFKSQFSIATSSTTVDDKEVNQFKKFSATWWDEMGVMKPLHSMNSIRVPFVRDGLISTGAIQKEYIDTPTPLKNLSIIDIGCGGGILTECLSRMGGNVTGLDATSDLIEQAKIHASLDKNLPHIEYVATSVEKHAEANPGKYDAVVASEVLEHVTHKDLFLDACAKCLKPGGSIFITTINKTTLSWAANLAVEYVICLIPKGTHEWEKFIAPHHTQRHLEDYNCRTRLIHGMAYNVFTNTWCWTSTTDVNYALHAVKN